MFLLTFRVRLAFISAAGVVGLCLTGCGSSISPDIAMVRGRILLNGQPVPVGVISFIPQSGVSGPSGGSKVTDGNFEIPAKQGLIHGDYRVEVTVIPQRPEGLPLPTGPQPGTDPSMKADAWSIANPIQRYDDATQTAVLKPGENSYELDLKSRKK